MLDRDTRAAILRLREQGHALRKITKDLGVSRNSVRDVLASGQAEPPTPERSRGLGASLENIRTLYVECRGNVVRVQEELERRYKVTTTYSSLTRFCRQEHISRPDPQQTVKIVTGPGEEMQHDTSLYTISIGGRKTRRQCASLVLGYSRKLFMRFYPRFDRFACKLFLTEALRFMGGSCRRCVIDNSSVILACGAGSMAEVSPEMEAFERRFSFRFLAHELGHANRKGKIERPYSYIEGNFLVGRSFKDDADLNRQARQWLDEKANVRRLRELGASPQELFAAEQAHLQPLPLYVPEVYKVYQREVDTYGYIHIDTRRYSVPHGFVGKNLWVRETEDAVIILDGHKELARHTKLTDPAGPFKSTLPGHEYRRRLPADHVFPQEVALKALGTQAQAYLEGLKAARRGRAYRWSLKILHRLLGHYAAQDVAAALTKASEHNLWDVRRIEGVLLQQLGRERFQLPLVTEDYEANPEFEKGAITPPADLSAFIEPVTDEGEPPPGEQDSGQPNPDALPPGPSGDPGQDPPSGLPC